jgi:PAS domain S-box-containing protein
MNTATMSGGMELVEGPARKPPSVMPVLLLSVLMLVAAAGASAWIYVEGTRALRTRTEKTVAQAGRVVAPDATQGLINLWRQMDDWAKRVTIGAVTGCAGFVFVVVIGLCWWRRVWIRHTTILRQDWEENARQLEESTVQVRRNLGEKIRLEEELKALQAQIDQRVEERTATLAKAHASLEKELNERKQAERSLAMQTKELERSKDVLELHVQARTQELQKLQRRNESILNSAGEGIYGLDLHSKTTFVNPAAAKLTGWKVEEMVGKLERDVFRPAAPENSVNGQPEQAAGVEHVGERTFCRKDGSPFLVEYMRTPIKEKDRVVGEVVIFKDITERKRTEEALGKKAAELARSNAELEQFAFVASHDLQEPLRKIQAFGDRLKSKCDAVQLAEGRDYLERMQSAAARMQTLINDLLTFSRVISASQPFVAVDLAAVTKEVLSDLEVRIEQTKAQMDVGPLPTIDADPLQMRQLLQNLIGNALKFQPASNQPVVKIHAQIVPQCPIGGEHGVEQEFCELIVQDNGIGFDEKYMDKIFAVFQRLHGRNEYEGTGVGLAVCRRITDRHGGAITARSKPGEGATFIVQLPVHHAKKEEAP